jgi:hypothetical protein
MDSETTNKYDGQKLGMFIFECVMAIVYVALSFILLFTSLLSRNIQKEFRIGFGVVFGFYGLFRVYRAYRKISQKMNNV